MDFVTEQLDEDCCLHVTQLPVDLSPDRATLDRLWELHPATYHRIWMHGRQVDTPRFQQAYGADYHYTGTTNQALPIPRELAALHAWCNATIDARLNGLLLNWYDAALGHYIGRHRDSTKNMCEGTPIVTLSLGEERIFRLRPWRGTGRRDFPAPHGTVFVMSQATNRAFTHEVPHLRRDRGRRISLTWRAFKASATAS